MTPGGSDNLVLRKVVQTVEKMLLYVQVKRTLSLQFPYDAVTEISTSFRLGLVNLPDPIIVSLCTYVEEDGQPQNIEKVGLIGNIIRLVGKTVLKKHFETTNCLRSITKDVVSNQKEVLIFSICLRGFWDARKLPILQYRQGYVLWEAWAPYQCSETHWQHYGARFSKLVLIITHIMYSAKTRCIDSKPAEICWGAQTKRVHSFSQGIIIREFSALPSFFESEDNKEEEILIQHGELTSHSCFKY